MGLGDMTDLERPPSMLGSIAPDIRKYKKTSSAKLLRASQDIHAERRELADKLRVKPEDAAVAFETNAEAVKSSGKDNPEDESRRASLKELVKLHLAYEAIMDEFEVRMGRNLPAQG